MDRTRPRPSLFGDGQAAERIAEAIEDLQRRHVAGRSATLAHRAAEGARS
jgi:hypothetical protein